MAHVKRDQLTRKLAATVAVAWVKNVRDDQANMLIGRNLGSTLIDLARAEEDEALHTEFQRGVDDIQCPFEADLEDIIRSFVKIARPVDGREMPNDRDPLTSVTDLAEVSHVTRNALNTVYPIEALRTPTSVII